ncbi:hypothetical protein M0Q50_03795 [bacterium]|nr:hypothetical protein [bacterium]
MKNKSLQIKLDINYILKKYMNFSDDDIRKNYTIRKNYIRKKKLDSL